jgi:hypothetical protein
LFYITELLDHYLLSYRITDLYAQYTCMHSTPRPFMLHLTRLTSHPSDKDNLRRTTSTTPIPTISPALYNTTRSGPVNPAVSQSSNPGTRTWWEMLFYFFPPLHFISTQPTAMEHKNATMRRARPIPWTMVGFYDATPNDLNCSQCHSSGCSMPKRFPD